MWDFLHFQKQDAGRWGAALFFPKVDSDELKQGFGWLFINSPLRLTALSRQGALLQDDSSTSVVIADAGSEMSDEPL